LRKYLIAALAAVLSIAVASVAVAQNPDPSASAPDVRVTVSPAKTGTKKKPRNSTLKLFVKNNRTDATVDTITVNIAKNVKLNGKGFKYCSASKLNSQGKTACPAGSKAGSGTANAVVGPDRVPLKFTVDAYVGGKSSIIFYTQQVGGTVRKALVGKVSKTSGKYGSKIVIKIDDDLQQPAFGVFSSLVDLNTTIKAKRGKNYLVTTNGCPKDRKHRFGVKFGFRPNATFPATGSASGVTDAPCAK
jgi:opacity protein-like surface antigen